MPQSPAPPAGAVSPTSTASPASPSGDFDASAELSAQFHIDHCSTLHAPGRPAACNILVVVAHSAPQASRINRKLAEAANRIAGAWVDDLYETYPEFYIDVARERSLLAGADTLVLLFPTQWYATPALLKEWFDVVLHNAWQGGQPGHAPQRMPRRCWIVTSTGSPQADFAPDGLHGRPFEDFLAPLLATARVCGMEVLAPLVLYAAHDIDGAAVDAHVARFTAQLEQLVGAAAPAPLQAHLQAPWGPTAPGVQRGERHGN